MDLNKIIRFVVATEHNKESFKNTDFFKFKRQTSAEFPFIFSINFENKKGLSSIYNQYLTKEYKDEYVIFVHDDVQITDMFAAEKIVSGLIKYNIIGLAGTSKIVNTTYPAWHIMAGWQNAEIGKKHSLGEVAHKYRDNSVTTSVYGPTSCRALLLDGLFLGVDVNSAVAAGVTFDEDFNFHHYDLSFCLRANKAKLTMGVIQLFCTHAGLGDSMNTEEWKQSAAKFMQKYLK